MPRFEPFAALRYDAGRVPLASVVAPPYDVISPERRARLAAQHPYNVVHLDLPVATDGRSPYEAAAELLRRWREEGVLVEEPSRRFYTYRMASLDEVGEPRHTLGVIGALELSRPDEGQVLPHEHTTPKARTDRLEMLRACRANLSPIWALSPAAGLSGLLGGAEPLGSWTASDGTVHELGFLEDPARIEAIRQAVGSAPVVIADGHHRYETSLTYRDERRATTGGSAGSAELTMTLVVELVEHELTVLPIHRLVAGLPDGFDLPAALQRFFEVGPPRPLARSLLADMERQGSLCLLEGDQARLLAPRPEALADARDLDASRLDLALAALPPHELRFQHGLDHVAEALRRGEAQAAFLLRPVAVSQIAAIADGGERMPPKSTYFHPKPSTGALFRTLDD